MKNTNKSEEYFNTAKEKEEQGLYQEALLYYTKSVEEDPNNIEAYFCINLINSYFEFDNNQIAQKRTNLLNIFNDFDFLDEE